MGSGEGDVAYLKVATTNTTKESNVSSNLNNYYPYTTTGYPYTYYYTYPTVVYKYQVRCPKTGCKKYNWLELDKVTPCYNCGSKLKAVMDVPDFTVPVK